LSVNEIGLVLGSAPEVLEDADRGKALSPSPVLGQGSEDEEPAQDHRLLIWIALLAVPAIGIAVCLFRTRNGPASDQDSTAYVGAAYNLLHGRGLTTPFDLSESTLSPAQVFSFHGSVPLVHYPPLFPVILAGLSSFGTSIISSARWLNAVLLGANLLMFELLLRRFTKSKVLLPVAGALLLLAGPSSGIDFLSLHSAVLSEPLLIFVFLLGLLLVDRYLDDPSIGRLAGIAACAAAAPLVRYAGFSFVGGAVIVLLAWAPLPLRQRVKVASIVAIAGVGPSVVWSLVVSGLMHGGSARNVAWHPEPNLIHALLAIGSVWIFPFGWTRGVRDVLFVVVLVAAGALLVVRRRRSGEDRRQVDHVFALVVFALSYLFVVVMTREFLDAILGMNDRILAPLVPLLYLIVIAALAGALGRFTYGLPAIAVVFLVVAFGPAQAWVNNLELPNHPGPSVAASPTMKAIRQLPPGTVITSSVPDWIFSYAGRSSIRLPVWSESLNQRVNPAFESQLQQFSKILVDHHGVLVVIPKEDGDAAPNSAFPANFVSFADVYLARRLPDGGRIYRFRPLGSPRSSTSLDRKP
jgi:hypothetical protein